MLIHQTKTSFWRTFHHSQPISSLLISNPSLTLCIKQYNLYFVNARALKNPSRNVSAKTLTTNFAIHVKIGRTLLFTVQYCVVVRSVELSPFISFNTFSETSLNIYCQHYNGHHVPQSSLNYSKIFQFWLSVSTVKCSSLIIQWCETVCKQAPLNSQCLQSTSLSQQFCLCLHCLHFSRPVLGIIINIVDQSRPSQMSPVSTAPISHCQLQ